MVTNLPPGEAVVALAVPRGECLEFPTLNGRGYGVIQSDGVTMLAHRAVYEHHHGPLAEGLIVRHRCDNPPCVNILHLEAGTSADNARDMMERRRRRYKLTEHDVQRIRQMSDAGKTLSFLATHFDVSKTTIWHVVNRTTYSHVPTKE